jgi:hypothetical protein
VQLHQFALAIGVYSDDRRILPGKDRRLGGKIAQQISLR